MLALCHWIDQNKLLMALNSSTFFSVVLKVSH